LNTFGGSLYKAFYFTALPPENEQSTLQPLIDYLEFNGFTVIKKQWKEFNHSPDIRMLRMSTSQCSAYSQTKGNMDIEIAVIAEEIAPYIRNLYLFSGDGDFRYLIRRITAQAWFACDCGVHFEDKSYHVRRYTASSG